MHECVYMCTMYRDFFSIHILIYYKENQPKRNFKYKFHEHKQDRRH